jgi:DNA-binding IclR family transcriptional regulator
LIILGCVSTNLVAASATYHSAERVLALLASFEDGRPELSVTEIAEALGVHKSTASRLAATLERTGFLARSGKRYRLGVEIIRLGSVALRGAGIVARLQPAMNKLSGLTGETINLAVPAGPDILNVAEVPSSYILNSSGGWIGRRTKPHAVANGKVLLAFGAIPMPATLDRYTEHTICSVPALQAQLAEIRRDGYGTAVAELEDGLVAVAAPVFSLDGDCVAALSISGPAYRMLPDKLPELGRLCAGAH